MRAWQSAARIKRWLAQAWDQLRRIVLRVTHKDEVGRRRQYSKPNLCHVPPLLAVCMTACRVNLAK